MQMFRHEFNHLPKKINWFPGHMRKALRELDEEIKKAEIFLEVRDARIPISSHNSDLLHQLPSKMKRLIIFNKIDLANESKTIKIMRVILNLTIVQEIERREPETKCMHLSTKKNMNLSKLLKFINTNLSPKFLTVGGWMMIGGVPNVGKSTIINALRTKDDGISQKKRAGARTGGQPCLTKSISGFKIITDPPIYLIDTPGIIQPKIRENSEDGLKLSLCHCIRDGILEPELIADYLLFKLNKEKAFAYVNRYNLPNRKPIDDIQQLLQLVKLRYGAPDQNIACGMLLRDFREGTLGQITLDDLSDLDI